MTRFIVGVSCWKCGMNINLGDDDKDAPKYAHKECPAEPSPFDAIIKEHDKGIRRHEIGKMKALMRKYPLVAIEYMKQSNGTT